MIRENPKDFRETPKKRAFFGQIPEPYDPTPQKRPQKDPFLTKSPSPKLRGVKKGLFLIK